MNETPEQLCAKARAGDRAAASALVQLLYARIYSFLRRQCASDADAADLTQQTFCQVWSSLPMFRGHSTVSTWIHGIAYNVYRSWRRKKNPQEAMTDDWWETCPALIPNPFESAEDKDLSRRLFSLVSQLEDGERQTIELHYYQGLSIEETAQAMNIATSTVKYRVREAVKFLRNHLADSTSRCNAL